MVLEISHGFPNASDYLMLGERDSYYRVSKNMRLKCRKECIDVEAFSGYRIMSFVEVAAELEAVVVSIYI